MKIIDLTLTLSNEMRVFPGDIPINIYNIQNFEKDLWNMKRLEINGHDGTHINAQIHGMKSGKSLEDYSLDAFIGKCIIFENLDEIKEDTGLIVRSKNIDMNTAIDIAKRKPKFIGLSSEFEMDIDVEKYFFQKDILVYERIANAELLPKQFIFHGVPLKIKDGDGSPIRAYAIIE
jgi:kynurenine formamidase